MNWEYKERRISTVSHDWIFKKIWCLELINEYETYLRCSSTKNWERLHYEFSKENTLETNKTHRSQTFVIETLSGQVSPERRKELLHTITPPGLKPRPVILSREILHGITTDPNYHELDTLILNQGGIVFGALWAAKVYQHDTKRAIKILDIVSVSVTMSKRPGFLLEWSMS